MRREEAWSGPESDVEPAFEVGSSVLTCHANIRGCEYECVGKRRGRACETGCECIWIEEVSEQGERTRRKSAMLSSRSSFSRLCVSQLHSHGGHPRCSARAFGLCAAPLPPSAQARQRQRTHQIRRGPQHRRRRPILDIERRVSRKERKEERRLVHMPRAIWICRSVVAQESGLSECLDAG